MEILFTAILGLICAVIAAYIWETKIRDRISVKRIINAKDEDIVRLIELYVDLSPDDHTNYSSDDIINMIDQQTHSSNNLHVEVEDFVLVAKHRTNVVGFLFCHYYPQREKAIISYYGIDKSNLEARREAVHRLLDFIRRKLTSKGRKCQYLFFDVERPDSAMTKEEITKRKARISILKQSALAFGFKAYCLKFDYLSPRITLSEGTERASLILMVILLSGPIQKAIPRDTLLEFLAFVYNDCYGDIYELDDSRHAEYQAYLQALLNEYRKTLPLQIDIL